MLVARQWIRALNTTGTGVFRATASSSRVVQPTTGSLIQPEPPAPTPQVFAAKLVKAKDPKYNSIQLELDEAEYLRIPLVWLRDHCRSPGNYNWETNQRRSNATSLFDKAILADKSDAMDFDSRNQLLSVRWADGHESVFQTKELLEWAVFTRRDYDECASRTYWTGSTLREFPTVSSRNFDFAVFSRLFVRFGVVAVVGVDSRNERATKALCEQIAPMHSTFFGSFWLFGTDANETPTGDYEDTAYGTDAIGPHTDGTYLEQSPGVQVFHCLRPAEEGGETTLVDGFAVAHQLRQERPDLFETLATTQIEHHYLEGVASRNPDTPDPYESTIMDDDDEDLYRRQNPKVEPRKQLHARSISKSVIECFKHKVIQIRFNPYDRAPLRTLRVVEMDEEGAEKNVEKTVRFYEAYERFSQLMHEPGNAFTVKLEPGTVVFIDNFRVMHARNAYKGLRKMCGCYLSRDTLLAKARPHLSADYYKNV